MGVRRAVCVGVAYGLAYASAIAAELWADFELTGVVQNIASADYAVAPEGSVTAGGVSARATLTGLLGAGISALVTVEGWSGDGFEPDVLDPDLIPVNADLAIRTNRAVTEAYLSAELGSSRLKLSAGKADVSRLFDSNLVAGDQRTQFLHYAFRNSTAIEFPGAEHAPHALAAWVTLENKAVREGVVYPFGFAAGWAKMGEDVDDPYYFGELRFCPLETFGVSVFGWQAGGPHARWDGGPAEDSASGWGLSLDWEPPLTGEAKVFLRVAGTDGEVEPNRFSSSWSLGIQMSGSPWRRGSDVVGLAYGSSVLSSDYKATLGANAADAESVLEVYYRLSLLAPDLVSHRPGIEVSPNVQLIHNAGGEERSRDTLIWGLRLRTVLSF